MTATKDRTLMAAGLTQRLDPQSVVEDCVEKAGLADKLESVVVLDGLAPGDVVVTAGVQALRPGQTVRLAGAAS
jgi:hypothetical protein